MLSYLLQPLQIIAWVCWVFFGYPSNNRNRGKRLFSRTSSLFGFNMCRSLLDLECNIHFLRSVIACIIMLLCGEYRFLWKYPAWRQSFFIKELKNVLLFIWIAWSFYRICKQFYNGEIFGYRSMVCYICDSTFLLLLQMMIACLFVIF